MYLLVYKQSVSWNTLRDHKSSSKSESGASFLRGHANGVGDKHFKEIGKLMENTASGLESGENSAQTRAEKNGVVATLKEK